mmetsp:Transcript_81344/g.235886  ORF Transcript_81344/g.235886 Transcript_81344/m.235886 type:complete len:103 (-) Transcript_81344:110-418(-)
MSSFRCREQPSFQETKPKASESKLVFKFMAKRVPYYMLAMIVNIIRVTWNSVACPPAAKSKDQQEMAFTLKTRNRKGMGQKVYRISFPPVSGKNTMKEREVC